MKLAPSMFFGHVGTGSRLAGLCLAGLVWAGTLSTPAQAVVGDPSLKATINEDAADAPQAPIQAKTKSGGCCCHGEADTCTCSRQSRESCECASAAARAPIPAAAKNLSPAVAAPMPQAPQPTKPKSKTTKLARHRRPRTH